MKKLMILAVLLAAANNIHAASGWDWQSYIPSWGMTCKQWISDNPGKATAVGGALVGLGGLGLGYLGYRSLGKAKTPTAQSFGNLASASSSQSNKDELDETPYVPWDQRHGVGPLLSEAETAIKNNNLKTLENILSRAVALNLPYSDFDSFISRLQGITNANRFGKSTLHYKAIDQLLGDTLETAYSKDQQIQQDLQKKESTLSRWFGR